jgi:endonuclease/exonuclease/phosphatase (EEP) superfamily protein YafD
VAASGVAAIGVALACVAAWVPVWPLALMVHFRVQWLVVGVVIAVVAMALRARAFAEVAAIATLIQLVAVAPDLGAERGPIPAGGTAVRVLVLNVHTQSSSFAAVRQLIEQERPDVIGLLEVDARWLAGLAPALVGYAGRLEAPRDDNFGVALYARAPLAGAIEPLGGPLPAVVARVSHGGAELGVVLVHPLPPVSAAALDAQHVVLDAAADRARTLPAPTLLLGDLNTTPWSPAFARLLARSGLCDTRAGFGLQATFPASPAVARIPIDHVLASCTVGVRDRRIGADVGSDHLPVVIDLVLPLPASARARSGGPRPRAARRDRGRRRRGSGRRSSRGTSRR